MAKVMLLAASLLFVAGVATAGIIDPCNSPVEMLEGTQYQTLATKCYFACPQGDTGSLRSAGFYFSFLIRNNLASPMGGIPASDFWLIDCDPLRDLALCAGSASSNADSSTNENGRTTMSQTSIAAGGCAQGLAPVVQGYVLEQPGSCTPYCFDVKVRSCDMNGDLLMSLVDLSIFAGYYPPQPYNTCGDFDCNGAVALSDLSRFAFHYGPPGHKCT